jgi:hypothetical protein
LAGLRQEGGKPPPPFNRPNPLPSLTSRPNDSLLSTPGAAGGHTGPRRSTKNPVVHATAQAVAWHPCPALSPASPRDHHAPPHRPGTPGDVPGPCQRVRPHGQRGTGPRREGIPELSDMRDLSPRLRTGPVLKLQPRLPGGLFRLGPGRLPFL